MLVLELVFGKDVELVPHTVDRCGRLVARVFVDNQDAGLELLKQGLCWVYERYLPEASPDIEASYQQSQAELQCGSRGSGPWNDPFPVPPCDWRKGEKERSRMAHEVVFRGSPGASCQLLAPTAHGA